MKRNIMMLSVIMVLLGSTGCTTRNLERNWPEPRPLCKDIAPASPLQKDQSNNRNDTQVIDEPTGTITLNQVLVLSLTNNPELTASSWEVRSGEARIVQAGLFPNPEFEVEVENFGGSIETERTDAQGNPNKDSIKRFDGSETTVSLSQQFELGGKRSMRKLVASLDHELLGWDHESTRLDLITEVTNQFIEILSLQEKVDLLDKMVSVSEDVLNTVSERVKAGKVSPVEETKAKIELSMVLIEQERVKRSLDTSRKKLAAAWGSKTPSFDGVEGDIHEICAIPKLEALMDKVTQNPDVARWTTELEQRQAALKRAKAYRVPDVTLGGGVRYFEESEDTVYVMGVSLPLPIMDRNQGEIQEAKYNLSKATHEQRAAEISIVETLHEEYENLSTAFFTTDTMRNILLPGAQSAFDAANEGYREGKFDYLNVLDAQRSLFDVKLEYIDALAAYQKAEATIERLICDELENCVENDVITQRGETP